MAATLERSLEVLERTPATLGAMLRDVSDEWATSNYGEGTFSPADVVGHLLQADLVNWMPRARHILSTGDAEPLPPLDRSPTGREPTETVDALLDRFAAARAANLDELRALRITPGMLGRRGAHPELGAVTLGQLLAAWVVHDLHHTAQIAKAMAFQYRDDVGPWKTYLSILPR